MIRTHLADPGPDWCPNEHGGHYLVSILGTAAVIAFVLWLTGILS